MVAGLIGINTAVVFFFSGLTFSEIVIAKCLYIFSWNRMAVVNDHFVGVFLGLENTLICLAMFSIRIYTGEYRMNGNFQQLTGLPQEEPEYFQKVIFSM